MRPSTTPTQGTDVDQHPQDAGELAGEERERREIDHEVHEEPGEDRAGPQGDVAEQHGQAEERHQVGGAGHLLDVARQRAEHETRADETTDRGAAAPAPRCHASCARRPWRTRAPISTTAANR